MNGFWSGFEKHAGASKAELKEVLKKHEERETPEQEAMESKREQELERKAGLHEDHEKKAFWIGFEKAAYDYAHEIREDRDYYKSRSKDKPTSKLKSGLVGAGFGAVGGALLGALNPEHMSRGAAALLGGALGAGLGGLMGVGAALADKLGIEEAKRISKMPPKEQKEYLAYLARRGEITEREEKEYWKELKEERRHRDLVGAVNSRGSNF